MEIKGERGIGDFVTEMNGKSSEMTRNQNGIQFQRMPSDDEPPER